NQKEVDEAAGKEGKKETDWGLSAEETQRLLAAVAAIKSRQSETRIKALVAPLREETLQQAIAAAEKQADDSNKKGKAIEHVLSVLDNLVKGQVVLGRDYVRAARDFRLALSGINGEPGAALDGILKAQRSLERSVEAVRLLTDDLQNDYTAARLAFTAR